ncbi:MAG: sugar-binding domain-containing protein [Verrucomicrobiia bacterium]
MITANVEEMTGNTNMVSINILGTTNAYSSTKNTVQLQAIPPLADPMKMKNRKMTQTTAGLLRRFTFGILHLIVLWLALVGCNVFADERLTLNFNPGWKFIKADLPGAQQSDFDDSSWMTVSTPHTYNDVDTFDNFALSKLRGEQNQWSGRTWYRKTFILPDSAKGKRIYIEFEAVRQVAEVYLNGHLLGACKNGFVPFGFDLTPYVNVGTANVLAVMCDNRFIKNQLNSVGGNKESATIPEDVNKIQADQIPWNNPHWHSPHGGIYRNVRLYVTDPLHISLPLYDFLQTAGPYVYTSDVSSNSATVNLEVPIENGRATNENVELTAQVFDQAGKSVLSLKQSGTVTNGVHEQFNLSGVIQNPRLWAPDCPYVYQVVCTLSTSAGTVDTSEIPLGIRTVHWNANSGFWINDHHIKIHGWGQRPVDEWPGLGSAQPDWLHFYTLDLMKAAGANWVRWGHCAGGPAQIKSCDRLGLMVEQPGVDGEADTVGAAWKIRAAAFRDMIIYYRNNPSIMIWEGGNRKISRAHAQVLRDCMDEYDLHGGRAFAIRGADQVDNQFMDVSIGTDGSRDPGNLPIVDGEYDRAESPRRVWDYFSPPEFGYPEAKGQIYNLNSEQYAIDEVAQYVHKVDVTNRCGGANWIFSDSTSGGRNTVEVSRASGEVDGVRLPKEAYYACQTMFRDDPQVHIIGHWTYPAGTKKTIYVVSNCQKVQLFVNGKSLGFGQTTNHFLFVFPNVTFAPGEIKAVAYLDRKPAVTHVIRTTGKPVVLRLTPITGPNGLQADGSDVALINVEAVDAEGERCPTFQQRVDFTCTGPAIWRGGYNSGKTNSINNTYLDLECGINRVAVRSVLQPGTIIVTAKSDGLKSGSVTIQSAPFAIENGYVQKY